MKTEKHNRQELLVYGLLWTFLFLTPVVGHFVSMDRHGDGGLQWSDVFHLWQHYAIFLVVFLTHNFLLAPLLVERQRRWLYFSLVALLVATFVAVQCAQRPEGEGRPPMEKQHFSQEHHPDPDEGFMPGPAPAFSESHPPFRGPKPEGDRPPIIFGQHDVVATIVLILMLGMNIGVKLYFRQRRDRQKLVQLEKENLEQQLQYLKYQINPHFLMNTLNNIHALVDIDAEQAKESIVELSKIMRFMLYEGAKPTVPLARELAFTQDYIKLMRMRYTDRVDISVDMPQQVPDAQIPPLMLITFVENAFKHGVSYRQQSFISIKVNVSESQLHFTCANSKMPKEDDQHGGVGLKNVKQRLELIYGKKYTLHIDDQPEKYNIKLVLPL